MSNLNSYVELINKGSNADCICLVSNFDIDDDSAREQDLAYYKAGKAGDEKAAEAYVRSHSVIITDLEGNVQFDLINQMAYKLPDLKEVEIKENNNINKTVINNYFINYYKFINGQMSEERFNKRISRMIKG